MSIFESKLLQSYIDEILSLRDEISTLRTYNTTIIERLTDGSIYTLEMVKNIVIRNTLKRLKGNKAKTAKALGISKRGLRIKLSARRKLLNVLEERVRELKGEK